MSRRGLLAPLATPFPSVFFIVLPSVPGLRYGRYHASATNGTIKTLQRYQEAAIIIFFQSVYKGSAYPSKIKINTKENFDFHKYINSSIDPNISKEVDDLSLFNDGNNSQLFDLNLLNLNYSNSFINNSFNK